VCSHLRLLAACELVMNGKDACSLKYRTRRSTLILALYTLITHPLPGSLEGIDALVGCALVLPEKAMLNVG